MAKKTSAKKQLRITIKTVDALKNDGGAWHGCMSVRDETELNRLLFAIILQASPDLDDKAPIALYFK